MNEREKAKRILELVGAIFSIVFGGILFLGGLIILSAGDFVQSYLGTQNIDETTAAGMKSILTASAIVVMLLAVALIVLGAFCCPKLKVKPDGTIQKRFGLRLALVIMNGILLLEELVGRSLFGVVLAGIPFVLLLVSICIPSNSNKTNKQQSTVPLEMYQGNYYNNETNDSTGNNSTTDNNQKDSNE